jgi:hypothetical protein
MVNVVMSDLGSQGFGDLLACIRNSNLPLQNIHFVVKCTVTTSLCPFGTLCLFLIMYACLADIPQQP